MQKMRAGFFESIGKKVGLPWLSFCSLSVVAFAGIATILGVILYSRRLSDTYLYALAVFALLPLLGRK